MNLKTISLDVNADDSIFDLLNVLSAYHYMTDYQLLYRLRLNVQYTDCERFVMLYVGDESNTEMKEVKAFRPEDLYSVGGLLHNIQLCNEMNRHTFAYTIKILGKEPLYIQVVDGAGL